MKKNGFIFVETIVVLVITMLSLTMMLSSYLLVVRRNNINKYYNRPSEIYALYYVAKLGTAENNNYVDDKTKSMYVKKSGCIASAMNNYLTNCTKVFTDLNMQAFGVINDIDAEIDGHPDKYDNGTIEFLEHLQKNYIDNSGTTVKMRYVIGVFYIRGEYYYASIPIEDGV